MSRSSKPYLFSLFLGNFLSHYDAALFWALSPFLAPILFPNQTFLEGLTFFYLLIPLSKWARPIGALILGRLSVRIGAHKTLIFSLSGLAFSCLAMMFCPTKSPAVAFCWVAFCRMVMYFFSASESSAASWLILQNQKEKQGLMSGLIGSTHLLGYIFAALFIAIIAAVGNVELSWRWLYFSGALTGITAIFLRMIFKQGTQAAPPEALPQAGQVIRRIQLFDKKLLGVIALATCFSYGTYEVCMSIAYSSLSVITSIEKTHILWLNLGLLTFDALLLPWMGQLAEKIGKEKVMGGSALIWALCSGYFLDLLKGAGFVQVTLVRIVLIVIGVAFAAPYYSWASSLLPKRREILHLSLGSSIGKYVGGFLPAAIFFLYQKFDSFAIASLPLALTSFATAFFLMRKGLGTQREDGEVEHAQL